MGGQAWGWNKGNSLVPVKMSMCFEDLRVGRRSCAGRGYLPSLGKQAVRRHPKEGGVVSFLSNVEACQGRRWDWRKRLGEGATERPKPADITRLAEPGACTGKAGRRWKGEQGRGLLRLEPLTQSCW